LKKSNIEKNEERIKRIEERRRKDEEALQETLRKREEERKQVELQRKKKEEEEKKIELEKQKQEEAVKLEAQHKLEEELQKQQKVLEQRMAQREAEKLQREQEKLKREHEEKQREEHRNLISQKETEAIEKRNKYKNSLLEGRLNPSIPFPEPYKLDSEHLFTLNGKPDWVNLRNHIFAEGRLEIEAAIKLIQTTGEILAKEPNVIALKPPVIVVGDIHGQFYDLLNLISKAGSPVDTPYLFLGDYVDRGIFSMEVVFYLFSLKINFPNTFTLLRGNHESRGMTGYFNFKKECLYKYNDQVYLELMKAFDNLPIAATIESEEFGKYIAMHGGIGPNIKTINDINVNINRFVEVPETGAYCDLLWADPLDEEKMKGWSDNQVFRIEWKKNETRGCGTIYGYIAVARFLRENNLKGIIRAHEVKKHGFEEHKYRQPHPMVITVFSAPNYCGNHQNFAAYVKFDSHGYTIETTTWNDNQPYYLPNFNNVFAYSMPFLSEAFSKFFLSILNVCEDAEDDDGDIESKKVIRNRMLGLGRSMIFMKKIKEENLQAIEAAKLHVKENVDLFEEARKEDLKNEKRPPSWSTLKSTLLAGDTFGRLSKLAAIAKK